MAGDGRRALLRARNSAIQDVIVPTNILYCPGNCRLFGFPLDSFLRWPVFHASRSSLIPWLAAKNGGLTCIPIETEEDIVEDGKSESETKIKFIDIYSIYSAQFSSLKLYKRNRFLPAADEAIVVAGSGLKASFDNRSPLFLMTPVDIDFVLLRAVACLLW